MESELSFATLLMWAVAIQVAILGVLGLILVHRRFRRPSGSDIQGGPPSATRFRHRWLLGGGLIGAVLVAAGIYHFILPEEHPWYEHYDPRTKPDISISNHSRTDPGQVPTESSPPHRSHRDLRVRPDAGAPRIQEATRRYLRGRPPTERKGFQTPDPVLHTYLSLIKKWQMESRNHSEGRGLTVDSVYDRLVTKYGFRGSRSTVRNYFAHRPYFIPEGCGQGAEVDWIPIPVVINGEQVSLECLFMASEWSGRSVIFCYRCDHLASFLDAHIRAFDFFGGIFPTLRYRALSDPMAERLGPVNTPQKDLFDRFCRYYNFRPEFHSIHEGPDLDSREKSLRDLLSKRLLSGAIFHDLDELNRTLLDRAAAAAREADAQNGHAEAVHEMYQQEKICLLSFPETRFEIVTRVKTRVGPSGTLQVGENRYHVPKAYAGLKVQVALSCNRVDIFYGVDRIASFDRPCDGNRLTSTN